MIRIRGGGGIRQGWVNQNCDLEIRLEGGLIWGRMRQHLRFGGGKTGLVVYLGYNIPKHGCRLRVLYTNHSRIAVPRG